MPRLLLELDVFTEDGAPRSDKFGNNGAPVNWTDVQDKPSTFTPAVHNHDANYYTKSQVDAIAFDATGGLTEGAIKTLIQLGVGLVNVADFEAVGDGVADDTSKIQNAINYAAYNPAAPSKLVYIPGHFKCKTTSTLHLGYGDNSFGNNGYSTVVLCSSGQSSFDANFKGGKIIADFDNGPIINIQGGLRSGVTGVYIEGKNKIIEGYEYPRMITESWWTRYSTDGGADGKMTSAPNVVDNTRRGHFAITVDYAGANVADATQPWPVAPVYGYGKQKSSGVKIIECTIANTVGGIVIHPSDTSSSGDSNGDFIEIRGNVFKCKYGVSVGHTQSRQVNIIDNKFICWEGITTGTHGKQKGRVNYVALNHFSGRRAMYIIDMSWNGPLTVIANYSESLERIAKIQAGGSGAATPSFIGNTWLLGHIDGATHMPDLILEADNITFKSEFISSPVCDMKITSGTAIFEASEIQIVTSSDQYNGVGFDWNTTNDAIFCRKYNNHPLSIYGGGSAYFGKGCFAIVEGKSYGGYRYSLYNEINNGKEYFKSKSIPGTSGRLRDYMVRSKSRGIAELSNKTINGIRFGFSLGNGLDNALQNSLMQAGDCIEASNPAANFYATILITERSGNNFASTILSNWTYRTKDVDANDITPGYYLDFDPALLLTSSSTSFFWYNTGWTPAGEAISGTVNASTNVIDNIVFDNYAEDHGSNNPTVQANLGVGLLCNFYSYAGTPDNPTSKMFSGKITAITNTSVTMEAGTMTGTLPAGTTVALFNKNPNEL